MAELKKGGKERKEKICNYCVDINIFKSICLMLSKRAFNQHIFLPVIMRELVWWSLCHHVIGKKNPTTESHDCFNLLFFNF
jgi:hypothetical protein